MAFDCYFTNISHLKLKKIQNIIIIMFNPCANGDHYIAVNAPIISESGGAKYI